MSFVQVKSNNDLSSDSVTKFHGSDLWQPRKSQVRPWNQLLLMTFQFSSKQGLGSNTDYRNDTWS